MRKAVFVICAIVLFMCAEQSARACQCIPALRTRETRIETLKKYYIENRNYAFFTGEVVKVERVEVPERNNGRFLKVTIKVEKAWKGVESAEAIVYTSSGGPASCGARYVEGQRDLVVAEIEKGKLWTNSCIGLDLKDEEFIKFLDEHKRAKASRSNPRRGIRTHSTGRADSISFMLVFSGWLECFMRRAG